MCSGYQTIKPELPQMPAELANMRSTLKTYLQSQIGLASPTWGGSFMPETPEGYSQAQNMLSTLLGYGDSKTSLPYGLYTPGATLSPTGTALNAGSSPFPTQVSPLRGNSVGALPPLLPDPPSLTPTQAGGPISISQVEPGSNITPQAPTPSIGQTVSISQVEPGTNLTPQAVLPGPTHEVPKPLPLPTGPVDTMPGPVYVAAPNPGPDTMPGPVYVSPSPPTPGPPGPPASQPGPPGPVDTMPGPSKVTSPASGPAGPVGPAGSAGPGGQIPLPEIFNPVENTLWQMMATGLPTNLDPRYQATLAQTQQQLKTELAKQMEAKNVTGGRYSSGAQQAVAGATGRAMTDWGAARSAEQMAALEAARTRQLQGAQQGTTFGQLLSDIPLQRAQAAAATALTPWQMQQQAAQNQYQAWQQTLPANNPFMQMAYGYGMGYPFGAQAPQVAENPWMGLLSGALGGLGAALA